LENGCEEALWEDEARDEEGFWLPIFKPIVKESDLSVKEFEP
jgi:hypothetical protein